VRGGGRSRAKEEEGEGAGATSVPGSADADASAGAGAAYCFAQVDETETEIGVAISPCPDRRSLRDLLHAGRRRTSMDPNPSHSLFQALRQKRAQTHPGSVPNLMYLARDRSSPPP
jgi:hypothetical protein